MVRAGWSITYLYGSSPTSEMIKRLREAGIDFEVFVGQPVLVRH